MRLAYIVSTLNQCGPVNVLYDIIANLHADNEIAVFTLASEPKESRAKDFEELGVAVKCVVRNRGQSLLFGTQALGNVLKTFHPDVVHVHGFRATLLCQNLPYPKVATVHNCIYEDYLTTYGKIRASWMARAEVFALKKFDEIVACSESNARYLRDQFGLTVSIVRNGVDQSKFFPLAVASRDRLRVELGIKPDVLMFVATGGCSEWKGTIPLVEAFSAARETVNSDAELHIFGGGPELERCKALKIRGTFFHGFIQNIVPWLQVSDFFVSASKSEGMPLAVLEAISCGLPALLSDIPSHREIYELIKNDKCAELFSQSLMKSTFKRVLCNNLLFRPTKANLFSSAVMAKAYYKLYQNLSGASE